MTRTNADRKNFLNHVKGYFIMLLWLISLKVSVHNPPMRGLTLAVKEPLGVISYQF